MKTKKSKITFEEKVKGMTAGEIIMAMVDGLKKKHVQIDMLTFGESEDGICYGCAATNAICEINGVIFTPTVINTERKRREFVNSNDRAFYFDFELAIDYLRKGRVKDYNELANKQGFAEITHHEGMHLPFLKSDFTEAELVQYVKLANRQS